MAARKSYDLKLDRAEHHLDKLERAIVRYADRHPYRVRERMNHNRDRKLFFFEFTEDPPDRISLVVGDFLFNLRASLDHIAGTLVPSSVRGHANFPVLWQGVWEPSIKGEDKQETRDRAEWTRCTERMPDKALEIIKANQPPKLVPNQPSTHGLAILNRLRNRDTHAKLVIVGNALLEASGRCDLPDGTSGTLRPTEPFGRWSLAPGEITGIPDGAMNVEIEGTVEVMIRSGLENGGYSIRETFRPLLLGGTRNLVDALRPFDRT